MTGKGQIIGCLSGFLGFLVPLAGRHFVSASKKRLDEMICQEAVLPGRTPFSLLLLRLDLLD